MPRKFSILVSLPLFLVATFSNGFTGSQEVQISGKPIGHWVKSLQDQNEFHRWGALKNLGMGGTKARQALPAIQRLLADPKPRVRIAAAEALGKIDPKGQAKRAVPVLLAVLEAKFPFGQRTRCLSEAAIALGAFGSSAKDALPALTKLARDKDGKIRRAAKQAVSNIRGE